MKSIKYHNTYKPSTPSNRKGGGVYLVSSRNGQGDAGYHFVIVSGKSRWVPDNIQTTRSELVNGLGKVIASCPGASPIQHLKQQMNETALS